MSEFLSPALEVLERVVQKGTEQGIFRPDINIVDLYITIMGLGYFYLSNRYSLSVFLDRNLMNKAELERWGHVIVQTVLASVRA